MIDPGHKRLSDCPAVRAGLDLARLVLPPAGGRERGEPRTHAAHRRGVPGAPVVRRPPDGAASAAAGLVPRPQARAAADEEDRPGADLSGSEDERAAPAAQDLSVSAAAPDDRAAEPGLVRRRHLHPDAARLPLPRRDHGLGEPQGPGLAAVEHDGGRLLRRGAGGGHRLYGSRRSSTPIRAGSSPASPSPPR